MQRVIWVHPDHEVRTLRQTEEGLVEGTMAAVSQQALTLAMANAATLLHCAGGIVEVVTNRERTGIPDEMVTTIAQVRYRDHLNARKQPERESQTLLAEAPAGAEPVGEAEAEPVVAKAPADDATPVEVDAFGDKVDVSNIPPELRG